MGTIKIVEVESFPTQPHCFNQLPLKETDRALNSRTKLFTTIPSAMITDKTSLRQFSEGQMRNRSLACGLTIGQLIGYKARSERTIPLCTYGKPRIPTQTGRLTDSDE